LYNLNIILDEKKYVYFYRKYVLIFRIRDENNLSEQLFILLKDIWWFEITNTSSALSSRALSISEFEQMTTEEIHLEVFSLESKIAYLQVSVVNIILL